MNSKKLEKQKSNLIQAGLMEADDMLVDFLQCSYEERVLPKVGQWKKAGCILRKPV